MNYFSACKTKLEAQKRYHDLAKINHPDAGGSNAIMQEINRQYEAFREPQSNNNYTYEDLQEAWEKTFNSRHNDYYKGFGTYGSASFYRHEDHTQSDSYNSTEYWKKKHDDLFQKYVAEGTANKIKVDRIIEDRDEVLKRASIAERHLRSEEIKNEALQKRYDRLKKELIKIKEMNGIKPKVGKRRKVKE